MQVECHFEDGIHISNIFLRAAAARWCRRGAWCLPAHKSSDAELTLLFVWSFCVCSPQNCVGFLQVLQFHSIFLKHVSRWICSPDLPVGVNKGANVAIHGWTRDWCSIQCVSLTYSQCSQDRIQGICDSDKENTVTEEERMNNFLSRSNMDLLKIIPRKWH